MTEQAQSPFYLAIEAKAGAQVLKEQRSDSQLRLTIRVPKGPTSQRWSRVVDLILSHAERSGGAWSVDVSRHHFLVNGVQRWAWRVIFQGEGHIKALGALAVAVNQLQVTTVQLMEVALHGSPNRKQAAGFTDSAMTLDRVAASRAVR